MDNNKFYVYILINFDRTKTYVGFTENIERRLKEHNNGKSTYTRKHKPWGILYIEEYREKEEAIKREKYYKSAAGRRKIKILLEDKTCPYSSAGYLPDLRRSRRGAAVS